MRLVITEGTRGVWARLESETAEEMLALEACDVQGVWTSGRGEDAISTLRALADQLGYPVGTTERRVTPSPPPRLVVVKRDARDLYERLTTMAGESVTVMWDRRAGERRSAARPPVVDRRRWDRRQATPQTWVTLGFLVARPQDAIP